MTEPEVDVLHPWRATDRSAMRIAAITGSGTLAAMVAAATLPLWVGDKPIRTALLATHKGQQLDWIWVLSATDAWLAVGLVLIVPLLCTGYGAYRARRRLRYAARGMPMAARSSTIGSALSERQKTAQLRSRTNDLAASQRRFTEQNRSGLPVLSALGATFAYLVGGWFLIGIALDVTGATTTGVGGWFAVSSWWVLLAAMIGWSGMLHLGDRLRKARAARQPAVGGTADSGLRSAE
jgi:hypothetical protein